MSERWKNAVVGLFVALGLGLVGYLIVTFDPATTEVFSGDTYRIRVDLPSTGDVTEGAAVHMNGINIGHIYRVAMKDPAAPRHGVRLSAKIENKYRIPRDAVVVIFSKGLGTAYIDIPAVEAESGEYCQDDNVLQGKYAGTQLIPEQMQVKFAELADGLTTASARLGVVADDLHELLQRRPIETVDAADPSDPKRPLANMATAVQRLDVALKNVNDVFGDPATKQNIKESLANMRDASAAAKVAVEKVTALMDNANEKVDTLAARFVNDADKLAVLLDNMNRLVSDIHAGKGTAGKLVSDARLYDSLVVTSDRLQLLLMDMQDLVNAWKQDGIKFKSF